MHSLQQHRLTPIDSLSLTTMSPVATSHANGSTDAATDIQAIKATAGGLKPTAILSRTPWQPPVARSAHGIYIELQDGRTVIDAVGGAAVACIGNGHPTVVNAIKEQVDKVSCECYCFLVRDD